MNPWSYFKKNHVAVHVVVHALTQPGEPAQPNPLHSLRTGFRSKTFRYFRRFSITFGFRHNYNCIRLVPGPLLHLGGFGLRFSFEQVDKVGAEILGEFIRLDVLLALGNECADGQVPPLLRRTDGAT